MDALLEEICLQIDEFNRLIAENSNKAKDAERDKLQGKEIRNKAMETQSQTAKRKAETSPDDEKKKKLLRSSGSETVCFLREKAAIESKLREQELELQKRRLELDAEKVQSDQNNFNNMLLLMSNQMNQNQQMTISMLERLGNNNGPNNNGQ